MEEKSSRLRWKLTVEGPLFLYSLILFLSAVVVPNLYLQKFCSPDGPPGVNEVCNRTESLAKAADVNTLRTVLRDCVAGVPVLLGGSWRDRTGLTRPLLVWALAGDTLATGVSLAGYYWWALSPWVVAAVEGAIISVTGGRLLFTMAAYCFIADHAPVQHKTNRLTMAVLALLSGECISKACSGYILSALNYSLLFIISIIGLILNIGLCFTLVKDKPKKQQSEKGIWNVSSFKTLFDKRPNILTIWTMLTTVVLLVSSVVGESSVFMYYLQHGFQYSVTQAGLNISFRTGVAIVGALIFSPLATNVFKWKDLTIVIVCLIISIIYLIGNAFVKTALELYLITLLDWSRVIIFSVGRSIMSKLLKSEELGVFFSLATIGEAVLPLILLPLYNYIFKSTLNILPGAFFILSGGINIFTLTLLCFLVIFKGGCKESDTDNQDNESTINKDPTLNKIYD